jgi:hypothetical protein
MTTNAAEVWIALAWGAVASAGLLIGAIVGQSFECHITRSQGPCR